MALFGCEADVGICSDSSAKMVEFFGEANYRRKVRRGESVCFSAMDRREVVVSVGGQSKLLR